MQHSKKCFVRYECEKCKRFDLLKEQEAKYITNLWCVFCKCKMIKLGVECEA
jgi:hypothetical protein